jgi:hypothetical protein
MEKIYVYPEGQISIHIRMLENVEFYERYPDNIVMILSKIGGLLAFLKIGFILRLVHRANAE